MPPEPHLQTRLMLTRDCVHLWSLPLAVDESACGALAASLAEDERARAARCRHPDEARRYQVARGALRFLLAAYLGRAAEAIRFDYGEHGHPVLAPGSRSSDLRFNLSHSDDEALIAFALGRPLGVDLEHAERRVEVDGLAARYCSAREQAALQRLDPALRARAFLELWTCKEAVLKAMGLGIAAGLAGTEIELNDAAPTVTALPHAYAAADWWLTRIDPAPGLVGALAVRHTGPALDAPLSWNPRRIAAGVLAKRAVVRLTGRPATA